MKTIYDVRLDYLIEIVNERIAPSRITVSRKKTGNHYTYTANIEDETCIDWICTGTYRELMVALYAICRVEGHLRSW